MSKPIELPEDVTQQAINMRKEGCTLKQIKEHLEGYGATDAWVKKICKGVTAGSNTNEHKAIEEIAALATRPEGVKPSEIQQVYFTIFGTVWDDKKQKFVLNLSQKEKNTIKRKVTKVCKDVGKYALFLPEWVQREHGRECKDILIDSAQTLHECLFSLMQEFKQVFPEATSYQVQNFIYDVCSVNIPKMSPEGCDNRFNGISEKIDAVVDNVAQREVRVIKYDPIVVDIKVPY